MKKKMLLIGICAVTLYSCEKDDKEENLPVPTNNQVVDLMPLNVGNYWVYDTYSIDTLGNETISQEKDTVIVSNDTLINGETFYVINSNSTLLNTIFGNTIRNTTTSIINREGDIVFTAANLGIPYRIDTINVGPTTQIEISQLTKPQLVNVSVDAGSFLCFDNESKISSIGGTNPILTNPKIEHKYYHRGVGIIANQYSFVYSSSFFESRLVSYHLN